MASMSAFSSSKSKVAVVVSGLATTFLTLSNSGRMNSTFRAEPPQSMAGISSSACFSAATAANVHMSTTDSDNINAASIFLLIIPCLSSLGGQRPIIN